MNKDILSIILGAGSAFFTLLFGEWSPMLSCLFVFIGLDIATGIIDVLAFHKSKYESNFSSNGLYQGAIRKALMLVVIVVATQADTALGVNFLRASSIAYLTAVEGVSVLENLIKAGVPVPEFLVKIFKEKEEEGENNGLHSH